MTGKGAPASGRDKPMSSKRTKAKKITAVATTSASSSSSSIQRKVPAGFAYNPFFKKTAPFTLIENPASPWSVWLKKLGNGLKCVELTGTLEQVWCNDMGWSLVVAMEADTLSSLLQCADVNALMQDTENVKFIPWGKTDDVYYMKVKNKQPTDEAKEVFFQGLRNGDGWHLHQVVQMHVDITAFCNFPEQGDLGVSVKIVTPAKVVPTDPRDDFADLFQFDIDGDQ